MPVKPPTRPAPNAVFIPNLVANLAVNTMIGGDNNKFDLTISGMVQVVTYNQQTDQMVITDQQSIDGITVPAKARNDMLKAFEAYALEVAKTMFTIDPGNEVVRQGRFFIERPIP